MAAFRVPAKAPDAPVTHATLMSAGASSLLAGDFAEAVGAFDDAVLLEPASKPKQVRPRGWFLARRPRRS